MLTHGSGVRSGRGLWLSIGVALGVLAADVASASDYYVDAATGLDANSGRSESRAWKTIARASRVVGPGDTVWIASGPKDYHETLWPRASGTAAQPIEYRGYGEGGRPRITNDGSLARRGDCILLQDVQHVVVSHIHCDASAGRPFGFYAALWGASRNEIRDCVFTGPAFGIVLGGLEGQGSSYNGLVDNLVHPTGPGTIGGSGIRSIQIQARSQHNLLEANDVRDGGHDSLQIQSSYNVVRNNRFTNPDWRAVGIEPTGTAKPGFDPAEGNVFERNEVFDSFLVDERHGNAVQLRAPRTILRYNAFFRNGGNGIKITRFPPGELTPDLRDNRVYHNVFYQNGTKGYGLTTGFFLHVRSTSGNATGTVLMNNVFLANDELSAVQIAVGGDAATGLEGMSIRHNVILHEHPGEWTLAVNPLDRGTLRAPADAPCEDGERRPTPGSVREFEACHPSLVADNLEVAPGFADPAAGDFALRGGSPLIDTGAFLTRVSASGSGAELPVEDARFFTDGNGIVPGDRIRLEGGARARIVGVDYERGRLSLDRELRFQARQGVHLDFEGEAPDIGAHERPAASP